MTVKIALVGVDWGSTNIRAFAFHPDGTVLASKMKNAVHSNHSVCLRELIAPWPDPSQPPPVLVCGMAGARGGWRETEYVQLPATIESIALGTVIAPEMEEARIVPGVSRTDGRADVMRGEEVQALGSGIRDGLLIAPGTHSKWITMAADRIVDFKTFMTGELYATHLRKGAIAAVAEGDRFDQDAYLEGVKASEEQRCLSETLFTIRARVLVGRDSPLSVAARLSGLLIGTELMSGWRDGYSAKPIGLVGEPGLTGLYLTAFHCLGLPPPKLLDPVSTTARGLWAIHSARQSTSQSGAPE